MTPKSISIRAHAKINWMLRVLGKRNDGYHNLETLFQSISLADDITIESAESFSFLCDDPSLPSGEDNLVVKAYRRMQQEMPIPPVKIVLSKQIPSGGGLGGGSSNAAGVMRALLAFADRVPTAARMSSIALELGSDVPYFLVGGAAYGKGRGEMLTALPDPPTIPLLLLLPEERMSTAEAFRMLDERGGQREADHQSSGADATFRTMLELGFDQAGRLFENDFESVVFPSHPHFAVLREQLVTEGAFWARMSGSGSTIAGAFADVASRDRAFDALSKNFRAVKAETISRAESL